jgi:hypothetical protein
VPCCQHPLLMTIIAQLQLHMLLPSKLCNRRSSSTRLHTCFDPTCSTFLLHQPHLTASTPHATSPNFPTLHPTTATNPKHHTPHPEKPPAITITAAQQLQQPPHHSA